MRRWLPNIRILRWTVGIGAVLLLFLSLLTQSEAVSWSLASVEGLGLSLYLANESRHDLRLLPRTTNGRRLAAWGRLAREIVRISVHAAFLCAGLGALDVLPLDRDTVITLLMYGNVGIGFNSLIDARLRFLLYSTRDDEPELPH